MSHTAFFYGTLMAPPVLHRVIHGSPSAPNVPSLQKGLLRIRPAILHAHKRHKVKNADYPAILPCNTTSSVRGTLVSGLTDGDIWRLDIFEGSEYSRRKVDVRVLEQKKRAGEEKEEDEEVIEEEGMGNIAQPAEENIEGEQVEAEVYVWIADEQFLEREEWDFAEFVRDKMARWVGGDAAETDEGFQGRQSFIDVDDAVAALQDPTGGRGANGNITRALEENGRAKREVLESAV